MNGDTTVRILDHRTPEERDREFLPGMGRPWMLPFYDVYSRFSGVRPLHDRAAALAGIAPGESVLDVGCGTANLSLAVLRAQPAARVTGLDPDAAALRTAARKASRRRVPLTLVQGFADRLPADDGSLDHIVSALALHHVPDEARTLFGREAFRALRQGGTVTIVDFGGPEGAGAGGHGGAGGHEHPHWYGRVRGRGRRGHGGSAHGGSAHGEPRPGGSKQAGAGHGELGPGGSERAGAGPGEPGHGRVERGGAERGHAAVAANPYTARNLGGGLVRLLTDAGFTDAREVAHAEHRFGPLTFVQATRD